MAQAHAEPAAAYKSLPPSAWQTLNQAQGIVVGPSPTKAIQVVFDPNCPYSAVHYRRLQSLFPELSTRWVPIGYYKADSETRSAALLAAEEPPLALDQNFNAYDFDAQQGGYTAPGKPAELPASQLQLTEEWADWIGATPITLVRKVDGRVLMHTGAVTDLASLKAFAELLHQADPNENFSWQGLQDYRPTDDSP